MVLAMVPAAGCRSPFRSDPSEQHLGSVMKRVTITTLAEELGVSICTINKALSGKPKVSAATRERVMAAAARHGYRPNRLAQALVRPVRRVVVLCPDDWPSHYGLILRGATAAFGRLGDYRITAERQACGRISDDAQFLSVLGRVLADRPDALLLVPGVYRPDTLDRARAALAAAAVTTILVGIETPGLPYLTGVWHDSARCGRLAAELLAFMGDGAGASAAILVGTRDSADHRSKIAAFQQEAAALGLPVAAVVETHDDVAAGYPVTAALLRDHPDLRCLYISSENIAGACQYLVEQGHAGRIRVVGTGISAEALAYLDRGVLHACLYQNQYRQGVAAVELLHGCLDRQPPPAATVLISPSVVLKGNADLYADPERLDRATGGTLV